MPRPKGSRKKAITASLAAQEKRAVRRKGERRALEEAHALRALLTRTPHHPAADPAAAAATHKKKSIGLGDEVKVWLKYTHTHVHTGAGEWLDAKVLRVDEAIGLYCVGLSGTFCIWVVLEQLRLVAAAAKPTIAKELAADAAELADIETWNEGTLRANQNTCSARTKGLIKIIRDRRNAAKRWCDGLARVAERRRETKERFAAEAPARAAAKAAKSERIRAERARPPPPTRASHPRPGVVLRALGGSKRAPDDAPPEKRARRPPPRTLPQEAAAAPASPTRTPFEPRALMSPWATDDDEADDAASPAGSELGDFSFGPCSVEELAAFGVVEGTHLASTILTYRQATQHARRIEANKLKF